ncbi:MAG: hypothetical protein JOS17DRAFT_763311 [Linnemannia elongata]|nr:MAG: hypothetical protein JOS17DRAFT_763311 [Linnemannia elongata]
MSTVSGTFRVTTPGITFRSTFVIDKITHSFEGNFGGISIEPCSGVVTLTFASVDDLSSNQDFTGVIGRTTVKITLANGVAISGNLDYPITVGNAVTGSGKWIALKDS